jgi:galactonate dehydratase
MPTVPNFFRQEFVATDVPWRDACLSHLIPLRDGCFVLSDRTGLGFEVIEAELARHP